MPEWIHDNGISTIPCPFPHYKHGQGLYPAREDRRIWWSGLGCVRLWSNCNVPMENENRDMYSMLERSSAVVVGSAHYLMNLGSWSLTTTSFSWPQACKSHVSCLSTTFLKESRVSLFRGSPRARMAYNIECKESSPLHCITVQFRAPFVM